MSLALAYIRVTALGVSALARCDPWGVFCLSNARERAFAMVKEIQSKAEFDQILKEQCDKLIVVDFTASWCGPCQFIAPYFIELSGKFTEVVFLKVDVDDVHDVAESCGIRSMPTFLFYKKGKKVAEVKGADKEKLKATIEKLK